MPLDLRTVATKLGGEVSGQQVLCPGPGHSKGDRSLSVKLVPGSRDGFVVNSFANDDPLMCKDYVRERLGLEPFDKSKPWGRPKKTNGAKQTSSSADVRAERTVVASYDYTDENGKLLFQVIREDPKRFWQRRPNGSGWIHCLDGVQRVLYRLPELLEAVASDQAVFIVEGEKGVEALINLGVPATCSPHGAGKWRDEYSQHLAGARVIILPDNDEPGRKHAEQVSQALSGVAASIKMLPLPGLAEGADVFDWIKAGGSTEKLWKLVDDLVHDTDQPKGPWLATRNAAEIKIEPVDWIWQDRIARGKHTALAGEPGLGKSQAAADIIARITKGAPWPNNEGRAPRGRVLMLCAEDGAADTIVPRLIAAGADLSLVEIIDAVRYDAASHTFNLQTDLALLEQKIAQLGDVLLVDIDPISSYFGKGIDTHKNVDVRGVLEPVSEMSNRLGVGILSITHFTKGSDGKSSPKALNRFMGSIAFVAAPRIAFALVEDPDNTARRLFLHVKNNLAAPPPGLAFSIRQNIVAAGITASHVEWEEGTVAMTADEAVSAFRSRKDAPSLEEAKQWLAGIVGTDGMSPTNIQNEANGAGLSWATVRRAKEALGLKSVRTGFDGGWVWKR
jgi:hypothetical protein